MRSFCTRCRLGALILLFAARAQAQGAARTVAPGMTQAEVVAALGAPTGAHTAGAHTYLFYANGCERTCGTADVVTLDDGRVVDALFRAPTRRFAGQSSSPAATRPSARSAERASANTRATAALAVAPARRARRAAGGARGTATRAAASVGGASTSEPRQTPGLVVAPRRQPIEVRAGTARADSTLARGGIVDTETVTGTRFGSPLTTHPGPATPQAPGIGAAPPRDSSIRNGVPLPPGSVPVPFQGARPSSTDSARNVNQRRAADAGAGSPAARPPR